MTFDPGKNELQGMHSLILVPVHTNFDQNLISGLGATVGDGQTDIRTDRKARDKTSVTFPKCYQLGTGNTKNNRNTFDVWI